jgi:hypothetical protein
MDFTDWQQKLWRDGSSQKGAKENNGLTIGILPFSTAEGISGFVDIPFLPVCRKPEIPLTS